MEKLFSKKTYYGKCINVIAKNNKFYVGYNLTFKDIEIYGDDDYSITFFDNYNDAICYVNDIVESQKKEIVNDIFYSRSTL